MMDQKTHNFYAKNAPELFDRYNSSSGGIAKYFKKAFPQKGRILDIGSASGRDVRLLLKEGHEAYGLEPCEKFRELSIHNYPELASRMLKGRLPDDLDTILQSLPDNFDGIVCSAVLMHIPREHLFDSIFALKKILKSEGRILISIPAGRPDVGPDSRDSKGRLFNGVTAEYLELLFERIGFKLIRKWLDKDSLKRTGVTWATRLFELIDSHLLRPIDRIEGVLNRDKKVATYKLALFRALCEISMTEFRKVRWLPSGKVGIPVQDIAEKWISYYWPLLESSAFVPQIQGEHQNCSKPLAFRSRLSALIHAYKKSGGLAGFTVDFRSSRLPSGTKPILNKLLSSLKNTIIKGPVTYAGGSLATGTLFEYDKQTQLVLIDASIWKEISLMNHWILDALILRWAELTARLSKDAFQPSSIIDLLLVSPLPERDVGHARAAYQKLSDIECVWTGDSIIKYDIDHVIPFSFWRNNDLWNLLPARPSVNLRKRDKLPSHSLINYRKNAIIDYWDVLKKFDNRRFLFEAKKLAGERVSDQSNWELPLFAALVEAIEVTALQRGCERWEP